MRRVAHGDGDSFVQVWIPTTRVAYPTTVMLRGNRCPQGANALQLRFGPKSMRMRTNNTAYCAGVWIKCAEVQWDAWRNGVDPTFGVTHAACIVTPDHHRATSFKIINLSLVPIPCGGAAVNVAYRASERRHGDSDFLPGGSATAPQ